MKTRIQKFLPWALPILVLVFVLSGCGKDNKIHALDRPAAKDTQAMKATTQAQLANGSGSPLLNPKDFADACSSKYHGRIEGNGTICASPVAPQTTDLNPSETAVDQVILENAPGDPKYLIIAAGDAASSVADITLNGAHFMSAGERKLSNSGRLAFYASTKSTSTLSVTIWKCLDNRLVTVWCNTDILKGN